jgi:hypothetical protein
LDTGPLNNFNVLGGCLGACPQRNGRTAPAAQPRGGMQLRRECRIESKHALQLCRLALVTFKSIPIGPTYVFRLVKQITPRFPPSRHHRDSGLWKFLL